MKTVRYLRSTSLLLFIGLLTCGTLQASDSIKQDQLKQFLAIYQESADIIGANTFEQGEIVRAGVMLQKFFTSDARVTVSGIDVVQPGTGRTTELFSEFVGRLFAHNDYYHTRHNADTGTGFSIEKLSAGEYKVISFVTADHYQNGGGMLKLAARYEDVVIRTNKNGEFKKNGEYFRVTHRSVFGEAQVSINNGTFEFPESIIDINQ